jgi:threonine aldolase
LEAIRVGISVLPPDEGKERIAEMVRACEEVAHATTGGLAKLLQTRSISDGEQAVIDVIRSHLERHAGDGGGRSGNSHQTP